MENEFLTEIESEGVSIDELESTLVEPENAFDITTTEENQAEKVNSDESSPKTNENEKEPSQEGEPEKDNTPMEENIPFHKHPRFQEIIKENKELKDEIAKVRTDVSVQLEEMKTKPTEQIPESFKKLFGDDPVVWTNFKDFLGEEKSNWKNETLKEIKAEAEAKIKQEQLIQQKEKETQVYFENQFKAIEASDGKIDRNAIVKILDTYHPIEPETGLYDIKAAYDIYKKLNKVDASKSSARKEIASTSTSKGGASTDSKPVTWDSLRNRGFGEY